MSPGHAVAPASRCCRSGRCRLPVGACRGEANCYTRRERRVMLQYREERAGCPTIEIGTSRRRARGVGRPPRIRWSNSPHRRSTARLRPCARPRCGPRRVGRETCPRTARDVERTFGSPRRPAPGRGIDCRGADTGVGKNGVTSRKPAGRLDQGPLPWVAAPQPRRSRHGLGPRSRSVQVGLADAAGHTGDLRELDCGA